MKKNYINSLKIIKPWGFEFVIYNNKKVCITFLNINKKKSTSLHCHPKKKTGFLILQGEAQIQLGLEKKNQFRLKSPERIMIRQGVVHKIINSGKDSLIAMEFETPALKKDLVRFEDKYGRKLKSYESKKFTKPLNEIDKKYKINLKKNYQILFKKTRLNLITIKNEKDLKSIKNNDYLGVINGNICDNYNNVVLSSSDIITGKTLKLLNKIFSIKKNIKCLIAKKISN